MIPFIGLRRSANTAAESRSLTALLLLGFLQVVHGLPYIVEGSCVGHPSTSLVFCDLILEVAPFLF
jgi:hypothetical protein